MGAAPQSVSPPYAEAVQRRFAAIAARHLRVDESRVALEVYLQDLGASSLDLVEITLEAEQEFGVLLAGKPLFDTAILIFGPGVLEDEGELSAEGKKLLRARFPHIDPAQLEGSFDLMDVQREITRVAVWIDAICALLGVMTDRCERSGGKVGKESDGLPVCRGASEQYEPPSLEELNERWIQRYHQEVYVPAQSL